MNASRRETLVLSGAILTALAGCVSRADETASGVPAPGLEIGTDVDEETVAAAVEGNTTFALDFLEELVATDPDVNHVVSPLSISMALAMTWAGARGETETEMADALSFPRDQDGLHRAMGALLQALNERGVDAEDDGLLDGLTGGDDDALELAIANAIWPDAGLELEDEFAETLGENYAAEPEPQDFGADPEGSREEINAWVAERTNDRIDELLPSGAVDGNTKLVLTNAVYLLADWLRPFDPEDTSDEPFTALDGSAETVAMMTQTDDFPYARAEEYQAVELPYVGEELSMVVVLPAGGEFEAFETGLDTATVTELFDELEETEVRLSMPRFEIENGYELLGLLSERMGMPVSGFDGIGSDLAIDGVYHDAFVAVDEAGTEAAAATAVAMDDSAPPSMAVDRPFLFLIRDRPTDSILFLGRVVQPPEDA